MEEKVSVIVPIYNVEKYLRRCIDSILNQTYKNLEIILVNDGSTDNCREICEEYTTIDNRIKVINKENKGIADTRNVGVNAVTGNYIAFVDSDDYIDKDMIRDLYYILKKYDSDISICEYELLDEGVIPKKKGNGKIIEYNKIDALKELIKNKHITSHCWNKLYKKELWNNVEFPIGKRFEDLAVMYLVFEKINKAVYMDDVKYYYIRRNNSIMKAIDKELIEEYKEAAINRCNYIKANYSNLNKEIEIAEVKRIKFIYDYIILSHNDEFYNNEEYIEEYKRLREYMKEDFIEIIKSHNSFRKVLELLVFTFNKDLYKRIVQTIKKSKE